MTELNIGRVQYEFSSSKVNLNADQQWKQEDNNDFPFPEKYYKNIGFTIHGFSFKFNNALVHNLKSILNPPDDLINDGENNNTELVDNNLTSNLFFEKQPFYKKCKNTKQFQQRILLMKVFLYNKSNTIKKTFITALNKQLSIYGSFSYFSGNVSIKKLTLLEVSKALKFLIEKKVLKDNLKLQIAYVSSNEVRTEDKKVHHFSIMHLGKRQKNMFSEPIETVIIRAQ